MQMFVTQGIKAVRMDDIAQQLGVSKRTLYELFGDKESLLYLALEHYFATMHVSHARLAAGAGNVLEAMFMVLSGVMDSADLTNRMMTNMRKFYPAVYEKLLKTGTEKNRRALSEMFDKGIADGLFIDNFNKDLSISVLYYTSTALFSGRGDIMLPEGMTQREAIVQIIGNFFRGISTAKGLELIDSYTKQYDPAKFNK